MTEYLDLFRQVVVKYDTALVLNAESPNRRQKVVDGSKQGLNCAAELWGYAIIQFGKRMERYTEDLSKLQS